MMVVFANRDEYKPAVRVTNHLCDTAEVTCIDVDTETTSLTIHVASLDHAEHIAREILDSVARIKAGVAKAKQAQQVA